MEGEKVRKGGGGDAPTFIPIRGSQLWRVDLRAKTFAHVRPRVIYNRAE